MIPVGLIHFLHFVRHILILCSWLLLLTHLFLKDPPAHQQPILYEFNYLLRMPFLALLHW